MIVPVRSAPSRGAVAYATVALAIVGLTVLELSQPRTPLDARTRPLLSRAPSRAHVSLIGGPTPLASTTYATDADATAPTAPIVLWAVERRGPGALLAPWTLTSHRGWIAGRAVSLTGERVRDSDYVGVGDWAGRPAALVAQPRGGAVAVEVRALAPGGALLARGATPPLGPPSAYGRNYAFARWSGSEPDLFVIDRGARGGAMRVRIYSGESRFHSLLRAITVRKGGFPERAWSLQVASVDTTEPDLLLISRRGGRVGRGRRVRGGARGGSVAIGVLTATSAYQAWGSEQPARISAAATSAVALAVGHINGVPFLYSIRPHDRTVELIAL